MDGSLPMEASDAGKLAICPFTLLSPMLVTGRGLNMLAHTANKCSRGCFQKTHWRGYFLANETSIFAASCAPLTRIAQLSPSERTVEKVMAVLPYQGDSPCADFYTSGPVYLVDYFAESTIARDTQRHIKDPSSTCLWSLLLPQSWSGLNDQFLAALWLFVVLWLRLLALRLLILRLLFLRLFLLARRLLRLQLPLLA